ncbi:uncharacterized protein LOC120111759 [Phoenix dactylifera]|uniref:Uncharacterized protein LOC120111759 n=1 Tax=Phoenix dactylifera TaxID=42345 RepID=A0A8B9ANI6_PHODC|nr:uncharacterized protein LOC120111759 [Phoenix dactylifera]
MGYFKREPKSWLSLSLFLFLPPSRRKGRECLVAGGPWPATPHGGGTPGDGRPERKGRRPNRGSASPSARRLPGHIPKEIIAKDEGEEGEGAHLASGELLPAGSTATAPVPPAASVMSLELNSRSSTTHAAVAVCVLRNAREVVSTSWVMTECILNFNRSNNKILRTKME